MFIATVPTPVLQNIEKSSWLIHKLLNNTVSITEIIHGRGNSAVLQ